MKGLRMTNRTSLLAVDEHGMPGMDWVDRLAECLVELRHQTNMTLDNQQVSNIVGLWQDLLDYDKQRVVFAARHLDRLIKGRFRHKKKVEFTPGVESVERCVLGSTGSPAQWPDCCRLVEAIFVRLSDIHKSPRKQGKSSMSRWTLILQDYRKVRQLILGNGAIMQGTTLQLVEVNQSTLSQWYNRRVKRQDLAVLQQGINLPGPLSVATEPLPPANVRPAVAPPQPQGAAHTYHLPQSTAGQAKTKRRATYAATAPPPAVRPRLAAQRQLFPGPSAALGAPTPIPIMPRPTTIAPRPAAVPTVVFVSRAPGMRAPSAPSPLMVPQALRFVPPSSCTTHLPQLRPAPGPAPRTHQRRVEANKCWRCGQHRTAETGHSQYKGTVYCPSAETLSREQWLEEQKKK
ncbi:uncharacterized protein LOC124465932 isoform X2 [Hypomesus transpacificus]|uniref:uncharacterized protein LOC124465932 isoform X2 n=1 Tax=Hypomesus transpacificus TaxID=137520 RepID=UPI001F087F37|nr:uncharacterized protein LOC124465932 isoform X2 [Hypomesus transpacificus]